MRLPLGRCADAGIRHPEVESATLLARDAARVAGGLGWVARRTKKRAGAERRSQAVDGGISGQMKSRSGLPCLKDPKHH